MSAEEAPLIGPALPPGYRPANSRAQRAECPRRPAATFDQTVVAGPALPPGFRSNNSSDSSSDDETTGCCIDERQQNSLVELRKPDDSAVGECNGKSGDRC
ncbi:GPALPP motifs-containing protein 1 [Stegostoma tigrinum]|uniref:GPALPP motifs-containing protein 1 n=1 Tax=Stegostoma tigrinum TaxID=3053191 RepID=UPI0028703B70|nr:GPALPP motifs-containing protein 1 [Stegostoma tigrinum]